MVRDMKRLVVLGLLAMLVVAASAFGRGAGFITLKPGDELDVVGTKILCQVTSEGPGEKAIACFKTDSKGPLPGTFAVGITQKAGVAAWKIDAKRSPQPVYPRNLSSAQRLIKVRYGRRRGSRHDPDAQSSSPGQERRGDDLPLARRQVGPIAGLRR